RDPGPRGELALGRLPAETGGARPDTDVGRLWRLRLHPDQPLDHRRRRESLSLQQHLTRERRAVQLAQREDALGHVSTLHTCPLLPKSYEPVKAPLSASLNILPTSPIEGGRR